MTSQSTGSSGAERGVGIHLPRAAENLNALGEKVSVKSLIDAYVSTCAAPGKLKVIYHTMYMFQFGS